jgi:acyl-CoA dehydrogenase
MTAIRLVHETTRLDPVKAAQRIGAAHAGPNADSVDRDARFPREAIAALRSERLLSAYVPESLGGGGSSLSEIAAVCQALSRSCASTGMVYAMHQIQVACLVHHGQSSPLLRDYLAELASHEWLLASATSELGVGGDVRTSLCAIERLGNRFQVTKQAPVISFGEEADGILVTARRAPDAPGSDQVLVLVRRDGVRLTRTSGWDSLGMRGTCSLGFTLAAEGDAGQILPVPYSDISSQTMLPVSHILWSSVWLGIATDAVYRARGFVRAEARKTPGTVPPSAVRLAEAVAELQAMRATVESGLAEYQRVMDDPDALAGLGFALRMNTLKVNVSRMVTDVVSRALGVIGLSGYKVDSKYAVGRHLRDGYGAALMIANDRILAANASMLLVQQDD